MNPPARMTAERLQELREHAKASKSRWIMEMIDEIDALTKERDEVQKKYADSSKGYRLRLDDLTKENQALRRALGEVGKACARKHAEFEEEYRDHSDRGYMYRMLGVSEVWAEVKAILAPHEQPQGGEGP